MKALKNNQVLSHGTQDSLAKGVGLVVRSADDTSPEPDWMSVETAAAMGDAQKLSAGLLGNQAHANKLRRVTQLLPRLKNYEK